MLSFLPIEPDLECTKIVVFLLSNFDVPNLEEYIVLNVVCCCTSQGNGRNRAKHASCSSPIGREGIERLISGNGKGGKCCEARKSQYTTIEGVLNQRYDNAHWIRIDIE